MEKDFNYNDVPNLFLHCQNAGCPLSDSCLRFQAALYLPADRSTLSIVNPAFVATQPTCAYFLSCDKARYALGITHLFNNLPHYKAVSVKKMVYNYLGRGLYYRIRNKERMLSPKEQANIKQLFLKEGIEEDPVFDQYIEQYVWSNQ